MARSTKIFFYGHHWAMSMCEQCNIVCVSIIEFVAPLSIGQLNINSDNYDNNQQKHNIIYNLSF